MAASDRTIVTIDVGGKEVVKVRKELFSVLGDNKFASMLSDRWQDQLDAEGRLFVDYSPQVFLPLIEFLRLARDSEPEMPAPVLVDVAYRRAWIRMMVMSSFHPKVLRKAGVTGQELRDYCGWNAKQVCEAGFTVAELRSGEASRGLFGRAPSSLFALQELQEAGYSPQQFKEAGFQANQLQEVFTRQQLIDGGFDFPPSKGTSKGWS